MLHGDFFKWVEREWEWKGCLSSALKKLSTKLEAWNKHTFGNIFRQKVQPAMTRSVQRALERRLLKGLLKLEAKLRENRSTIPLQEELLWLQKFCNEWLKARDGNAKFFHTSTLVRRWRKRTEALKND